MKNMAECRHDAVADLCGKRDGSYDVVSVRYEQQVPLTCRFEWGRQWDCLFVEYRHNGARRNDGFQQESIARSPASLSGAGVIQTMVETDHLCAGFMSRGDQLGEHRPVQRAAPESIIGGLVP
jgi:hypothetical protein